MDKLIGLLERKLTYWTESAGSHKEDFIFYD
jgi:hypothetical protein